jgi:hypothetical protein
MVKGGILSPLYNMVKGGILSPLNNMVKEDTESY